jgi:hypothetical protein
LKRRVLLAFAAVLIALAAIAILVRATSTSNPGNNAVPPLYLGLDSYAHWDKLSYLEFGDRIGSQTTADPGGSNEVINEHGTLLDEVGPGVASVLRFQTTYGSPWGLTVDGKSTVVNPSDLGEIQPGGGPASLFPYPLSINEGQSHGSSIIATALPFTSELKVTAGSANGNFYSMYRKLPLGATLPAYGDPAATSAAVALLRSAGRDIAPTSIPALNGTALNGTALKSPAGNAPVTLATISGGPYQIRAIKLQVPLNEATELGNAVLRIYWDGEASPSVNAPVKFLAGDGAGVYQPSGRQLVQGLLANITSDGKTYMSFNLYYPMPFASSARIVLVPTSASAGLADVNWSLRYQGFSDPRTWWAPFHANYVAVPNPAAGQSMTFLDYRGSGKLIGTVVNFGIVGPTLEGNPYVYLDGSQTPQFAGTGTEEWGFGGNYWYNGQQVSLAMAGLPSATNNPAGADIDGAAEYRFLIADSIPFNNRIVVKWEHGGTNDSSQPYRATMLWYGTPAQTAVLSDDMQAGNASSGTAHSFRAPGSSVYSLRAGYEYLPHAPLTTGNVVETSGTTAFTMKLSGGNVGAFLRRTFDSCVGGQRATVRVDGTFAGTWYNPGVSPRTGFDGHDRCWRDDDFVLPPGLTQGKSSVTIQLTAATSTDWTAADYELYSFVPVADGSGGGPALPAPADGGSPSVGLLLAALGASRRGGPPERNDSGAQSRPCARVCPGGRQGPWHRASRWRRPTGRCARRCAAGSSARRAGRSPRTEAA